MVAEEWAGFCCPQTMIESAPNRRRIGLTIWAVSFAVTIAWLIEAFAVGRGFISTYLAPLAIIGNLLGVFMMRRRPPVSGDVDRS
jgi:hypothetical protein